MNSTTASHRIDTYGAKMGMWLFLFTEFLLFGGLFLLYASFRTKYPQHFNEAASELSVLMGTANTLILVTSSLSMALAIGANRRGNRKFALMLLIITMVLGCAFLTNKYFEWGSKIGHGIYPGSPSLLEQSRGSLVFYSLYYAMTGLHGIHVVIGIVLLFVMFSYVLKGRIHKDDFIKLENSGLYWHLVDIIWIYLFQTFYLIT